MKSEVSKPFTTKAKYTQARSLLTKAVATLLKTLVLSSKFIIVKLKAHLMHMWSWMRFTISVLYMIMPFISFLFFSKSSRDRVINFFTFTNTFHKFDFTLCEPMRTLKCTSNHGYALPSVCYIWLCLSFHFFFSLYKRFIELSFSLLQIRFTNSILLYASLCAHLNAHLIMDTLFHQCVTSDYAFHFISFFLFIRDL